MADSIADAQNTSKEKGRVSISFLAQLRQEGSNLKRENLTHLLPPRGIDATVFGAIGDWRGMEHGTWSIVKDCGGQEANERRQMTASQMVNLSTSQMVMNGLNDESTSQPFDDLTNRLINELKT